MSTLSPHLCSMPYCTRIIDGPGRCDEHTQPGTTHGTAGYGGRAWRNTSRAYLNEHPRCEQAGCHAKATEVHHVDGSHPLDPHANDWHNLRALCHPCHSKTTARQRRARRARA